MNAADKDTINLYRNLNDRIAQLESTLRAVQDHIEHAYTHATNGEPKQLRDQLVKARAACIGGGTSKIALHTAMAISAGVVSV